MTSLDDKFALRSSSTLALPTVRWRKRSLVLVLHNSELTVRVEISPQMECLPARLEVMGLSETMLRRRVLRRMSPNLNQLLLSIRLSSQKMK